MYEKKYYPVLFEKSRECGYGDDVENYLYHQAHNFVSYFKTRNDYTPNLEAVIEALAENEMCFDAAIEWFGECESIENEPLRMCDLFSQSQIERLR